MNVSLEMYFLSVLQWLVRTFPLYPDSNANLGISHMAEVAMDFSGESGQHRLVHLDLKGAPPKISFYEQIFPYFKRWGATGLLVEYEDMFPYHGELADLAAKHAYSPAEINQLLELAKENNLVVIPLVQTFGHFEFVLKHDKFRPLREVPEFPMTLCPLEEGSLAAVEQMITQVIESHADIRWFHIGADEVFHIGICKRCHKHMQQNGLSKADMFFYFVQKVLMYLKARYPHVRPIMWDDMFREADLTTLQNAGIGDLVDPMVWFYQTSFNLLPDLWDRYSKVFPNVWAASAFKGATGPCMAVTDISYHLENHRGWIKVMKEQHHKFQAFMGYCITGWQRYDHYAVLCELLPVGIPCLAVCLLTLSKGSFTEEVHKTASSDLNFTELIPLSPFKSIGIIPECRFPGSDIYVGMQVFLQLKLDYKVFMKNDRMVGWMTKYHINHNFTNPAHIKHFLPQAEQMLESLQSLQTNMLHRFLPEVFYSDATEEWLAVNLDEKVDKVRGVVINAYRQIDLGGRPKDAPETS